VAADRLNGGVHGAGDLPLSDDLRNRLGAPTVIREIASSERSRVWLVELGGEPAVVKQIAGGADASARYRREIAALTVAASARPVIVPELLGMDADARVMVLEYVARGGPTAAGWHADYATALARLHAAAAPPHAPRPGRDSAGLPDRGGPALSDVRAFAGFAARLGVAVPSGAEDQLAALVDRLAVAGRRALLHGDPCPDNAVPTAAGMRFVDLEQAAWGPGTVELAYLTMAFPTCLCATATADSDLAEAIAAYRGTWRAVTGTDPDGDLTDAAVGWLITGDALVWRARRGAGDHLARAAGRDWRWGTGTARERVLHRLGVVAHAARDRDDLAHVARLCSDLSAAMLRRWTGLAPLPVANGDPLSSRAAAR
jgi:Ser/Thr protein kinase RdoA (MazF antagonist)